MTDGPEDSRLPTTVGLCARCVHAERVLSSKGSEFWLCRLAATDPRFRKYPALPVLRCEGFDAQEQR